MRALSRMSAAKATVMDRSGLVQPLYLTGAQRFGTWLYTVSSQMSRLLSKFGKERRNKPLQSIGELPVLVTDWNSISIHGVSGGRMSL